MEFSSIKEICFIDINSDVVNALATAFVGSPHFDKVNLRFLNADILTSGNEGSIVSPGNTSGIMTGGIEQTLSSYFGEEFAQSVPNIILAEYNGHLPIGASRVFPTNDSKYPHLILSPVMELPAGPVSKFIDISRAVQSALEESVRYNSVLKELNASDNSRPSQLMIEKLLIPGFGTGYGSVSPAYSATYMRRGFDLFANSKYANPNEFNDLIKIKK